MVDSGIGLTILGAALGGGRTIEKILGPTADYLGENLKDWTSRRVQNVVSIFKKAKEKLGDDIELQGSVPPKILKEILTEGSYCDDELTADYFAGVLVSGRSPNGIDDRAVVSFP